MTVTSQFTVTLWIQRNCKYTTSLTCYTAHSKEPWQLRVCWGPDVKWADRRELGPREPRTPRGPRTRAGRGVSPMVPLDPSETFLEAGGPSRPYELPRATGPPRRSDRATLGVVRLRSSSPQKRGGGASHAGPWRRHCSAGPDRQRRSAGARPRPSNGPSAPMCLFAEGSLRLSSGASGGTTWASGSPKGRLELLPSAAAPAVLSLRPRRSIPAPPVHGIDRPRLLWAHATRGGWERGRHKLVMVFRSWVKHVYHRLDRWSGVL